MEQITVEVERHSLFAGLTEPHDESESERRYSAELYDALSAAYPQAEITITVGEILSSIDAEDAEGVQIIADRVFARGSFWVVDD
jgi:hypothetical protein